ncbi:hypothetical protein [Mucilaginibacter terrae]|uniref:Outer membrane protein beta-barrel domain-containing protein n=1 Tax=Mucilaginibacter terrae TaxID=1955052 RepID=A0ABU3GWI2_9SPHI|nr:hypothetical protein [Mucilaginibacter terrae]MDT3404128.1 hypothetical protein [Mucilaginibacter terrae]
MKSSAWYNKLWRNKLNKLPVKGDAGAAWANMQQMLDAHLPVSGVPGASPAAAKSIVAKIVSMAAYVLPAAAMVGAATWFVVKPPARQKIALKPGKQKEYHLKADSVNREKGFITDNTVAAERMGADTAGNNHADTVVAYADNAKNNSLPIPENGTTESINKSTPGKTVTGGDVLLGKNGTAEKASLKGKPITSGGNSPHGPDHSTATHKRIDNGAFPSNYKAADKRGNSRVPLAYLTKLANGSIHSGRNNSTRIKNNGTLSNGGIKAVWEHDQKINAVANRYKAEIPKELNNYISASLNFSGLPTTASSPVLYIPKDASGKVEFNNSLLVAEDKPGKAVNSSVNELANNKPASAKPPKNKVPKEFNTPLYNWGLEAGLNLNNGAGWYVGIAADYALTNRLLIGAGLRLTSGSKISGSYKHPSFFQPDSAAAFTITEERKISAIQVPFNLTYKVSDLISIKAGAVINFAGSSGSASYTLGSVGSFSDTLRRTKSIDTAVSKSVLAGKVSLGFTGGVSLNFKNLSIDARYLALPPYQVNNPLGNYSGSYHPFQVGVTYWFDQGAKKQPGAK